MVKTKRPGAYLKRFTVKCDSCGRKESTRLMTDAAKLTGKLFIDKVEKFANKFIDKGWLIDKDSLEAHCPTCVKKGAKLGSAKSKITVNIEVQTKK